MSFLNIGGILFVVVLPILRVLVIFGLHYVFFMKANAPVQRRGTCPARCNRLLAGGITQDAI
jgi:phosphotransferase system  glucose/maltose/N-acetylglucosamine-specific IIC component